MFVDVVVLYTCVFKDQDLMIGPPTSPANLSSASDTETSAAAADAGQTCCCDSCTERRFVCM